MSHPNEISLSEMEKMLKMYTNPDKVNLNDPPDPRKVKTLKIAIARRKAEAAEIKNEENK